MTDTSLSAPGVPAVKSRSLTGLAWLRLKRNRAAVVSAFLLAAITLFCVVGPWISPHRYDQQFRSFVGVPPSLEPRPAAEVLESAMQRVAGQARAATARCYFSPGVTSHAPAAASMASMPVRSVGLMTGANSGEWFDGS